MINIIGIYKKTSESDPDQPDYMKIIENDDKISYHYYNINKVEIEVCKTGKLKKGINEDVKSIFEYPFESKSHGVVIVTDKIIVWNCVGKGVKWGRPYSKYTSLHNYSTISNNGILQKVYVNNYFFETGDKKTSSAQYIEINDF